MHESKKEISKEVFGKKIDKEILEIIIKMTKAKSSEEKFQLMGSLMKIEHPEKKNFIDQCKPAFKAVVDTCEPKRSEHESYGQCLDQSQDKMDHSLVTKLIAEYSK